MNYSQTLQYLYEKFPMFHRVGINAYKTDLNNTIDICNFFGNPQDNFKSVHTAGTNGKGSVSHFLASVLQEAGVKTGLFTSPHLKDFRERIKINGKEIPEKYAIDFIEKNKTEFEKIKPSFFEMTFGLASKYFNDEKVDVAVIETGLGGRLDSTNIITPVLSVITNISIDHTNLLGTTIERIAMEKAGIIKPSVPVVIGETQEEIEDIFTNKAESQNSPIFFADEEFEIKNLSYKNQKLVMDVLKDEELIFNSLQSELLGFYQAKNIVTALKAIDILNENGLNISGNNINSGISGVIKNTGLLGRWQMISEKPLTICDVAHNADGIREVVKQIEQTTYNKLHMVFGMVDDKETENIMNLLPNEATYYFCKANIPRALNERELLFKAKEIGLKGLSYSTVKLALERARQNAAPDDLIFICGSSFVVAEVV
ncbi:MAG: bifunctional folylpolyglutamate synthase/dihydrofolate synthase [Bacteroidales bacterium]|nr:bifunctional folylpolyglutamate synthase/dihydrofolate synthase [Bacteroidales bacterium]